jgi:hypothetical protein
MSIGVWRLFGSEVAGKQRQMPATSIPIDVLLHILEHVDKTDLATVCQLNKICCSYSQRILYRDIFVRNSPVCLTLARSTHLARLVRSFETSYNELELSAALQNMIYLRNLKLYINVGTSNVLDGCTFRLDSLSCTLPYDESLRKFLHGQPSLTCLEYWGFGGHYWSFDEACIPNLTQVTADIDHLPRIVPGRPVSEVHIFGSGSLYHKIIDFSFFTLSTAPIQKLKITHLNVIYPKPVCFLASIFPSVTHLSMGPAIFSTIPNVFVPFIYFLNRILSKYIIGL